jgi:hypothetical protein
MTRQEIQQRKELQENLERLIDDKMNNGSVIAADQILQNNPDLSNCKLRKKLKREMFVRDLYEPHQVWHGDHAGEDLVALSREELLKLLSIIPRTASAMRKMPKKAKPLIALHIQAMTCRKSEIEACLQAHAQIGEKFMFDHSKGAKYYREIPAENVPGWDYEKLPTAFILKLWREGGELFRVASDLYIRFDKQAVMEQIRKRPEIVQAQKGHYYDLSEYEGPAGKYRNACLSLRIALADGRVALANHSRSYEKMARLCGTYYSVDDTFLFAIALVEAYRQYPIVEATEKRSCPSPAEMKARLDAVFAKHRRNQ